MKHILVTGGARSGKSSFAEQLALRLGERGTYIATAQALDAEMAERVALHRSQRDLAAPPGFWATAEEPLQLTELLTTLGLAPAQPQDASPTPVGAITTAASPSNPSMVVLVDCLTLWLSNWVLAYEEDPCLVSLINNKLDELCDAVRQYPGRLVMVTNEVGSGIVPAYKLGRVYRDLAGRMNQRLAQICDRVFLVTAGIPVELKSIAFHLTQVDELT